MQTMIDEERNYCSDIIAKLSHWFKCWRAQKAGLASSEVVIDYWSIQSAETLNIKIYTLFQTLLRKFSCVWTLDGKHKTSIKIKSITDANISLSRSEICNRYDSGEVDVSYGSLSRIYVITDLTILHYWQCSVTDSQLKAWHSRLSFPVQAVSQNCGNKKLIYA